MDRDYTHLNHLKDAMKAAGITRTELAKRVNLHENMITHYTHGRFAAPEPLRKKFAEALHCKVEDIFPVESYGGHDTVSHTACMRCPLHASTQGGSSMNTGRRNALGILAASTALMAAGEGIDWPRIAHALHTSKVSGSTIENLALVKDRCYHLITPFQVACSPEYRTYVQGQIDVVTSLLETNPSPKYQLALENIAGELSLIAGIISSDLNDDVRTPLYYTQAFTYALSAKQHVLAAVVSGRQAVHNVHNGKSRLALSLLEQSQRWIDGATPTTKSWFWAAYAEAQAHEKHFTESLSALDLAREAHKADEPGQDPYYTTYNDVLSYGYQGVVYRLAGKYEDAERAILASLQVHDVPLYRLVSKRTNLGYVYLESGQIEAAIKQGEIAADIAAQVPSPFTIRHLWKFRQSLSADTSLLINFDSKLQALTSTIDKHALLN